MADEQIGHVPQLTGSTRQAGSGSHPTHATRAPAAAAHVNGSSRRAAHPGADRHAFDVSAKRGPLRARQWSG